MPFDACAEKYSARKDEISVQQQQQQQPKVYDAKYDLTHAQGIYSAEQRRQFTVTRTTTQSCGAKYDLTHAQRNIPQRKDKITLQQQQPRVCGAKYDLTHGQGIRDYIPQRKDDVSLQQEQQQQPRVCGAKYNLTHAQGIYSAEKRRHFTATRTTTTTQSLWREI